MRHILLLVAAVLMMLSCSRPLKPGPPGPDRQDIAGKNANAAEISVQEAQQRVNNFASIMDSDPQKEFPAGFVLSEGILHALYSEWNESYSDEVYILLGYRPQLDEFDLIFALEFPAESGDFRYLNFTKPCPAYCPENFTSSNANTLEDLGGTLGYNFSYAALGEYFNVGESDGYEAFCEVNGNSGLYAVACTPTYSQPIPGVNPVFSPCPEALLPLVAE